jgi:hypothetical protein
MRRRPVLAGKPSDGVHATSGRFDHYGGSGLKIVRGHGMAADAIGIIGVICQAAQCHCRRQSASLRRQLCRQMRLPVMRNAQFRFCESFLLTHFRGVDVIGMGQNPILGMDNRMTVSHQAEWVSSRRAMTDF